MNRTLWHQFEGQSVEGCYLLCELLGAGSFGGVFRSEHRIDQQLVREVAIKLIRPQEKILTRQLPELLRGTNLQHPNVVRCFSAGKTTLKDIELLYLILEFAHEGTLGDCMGPAPLRLEEIEELILNVASGLAYLHGERLVHRDLKPANLLRVNGNWKLSDFGSMRGMGVNSMSITQIQLGTSSYMPPESFDNVVSPAWDLWSLGIVLIQAWNGRLPFAECSEANIQSVIRSKGPVIPENLPEPLNRIVRGCLKNDPRQRWTAREVLAAVEAELKQRARRKAEAETAEHTRPRAGAAVTILNNPPPASGHELWRFRAIVSFLLKLAFIASIAAILALIALSVRSGTNPIQMYQGYRAAKTCLNRPSPGYYIWVADYSDARGKAWHVDSLKRKQFPAVCASPSATTIGEEIVLVGPYPSITAADLARKTARNKPWPYVPSMMRVGLSGLDNLANSRPQGLALFPQTLPSFTTSPSWSRKVNIGSQGQGISSERRGARSYLVGRLQGRGTSREGCAAELRTTSA